MSLDVVEGSLGPEDGGSGGYRQTARPRPTAKTVLAHRQDLLTVVLLLVCQGLESHACTALRAFARAPIILKALPAGGVDGEASVGKILASVPPDTGVRNLPGLRSSFPETPEPKGPSD
eukprot:s65_g12.t1